MLGGSFLRERSFIDGGGEDREGDTGIAEDFSAARGGGSKDEFHEGSWSGRILQT